MRAILGSYDSELTPAEYSPQLTRRMREAEDMVQKVHAHSSEMEVSGPSVRARSAGGGGALRTLLRADLSPAGEGRLQPPQAQPCRCRRFHAVFTATHLLPMRH